MSTGATKDSQSHSAFLAFTNDSESKVVLKQFATALGWSEAIVLDGDIDTASEYLKSHPSPQVLCVDITSAEAAPAALDRLADVCNPGIKVIVSGKINEYSFYSWLVEVGISNYLLKPFTLAALETAYRKITETPVIVAAAATDVKKDARIISVVGMRGGVGATTLSVNMAWILANQWQKKTALLDFDPQLGTVALALDLEPGRGLRDALEKPERIDGLFMDRVMVKVDDNLSILSSEEGIEEFINPGEAAAEALIKQTKPKFSHIIIDMPRSLAPFARYGLKHADTIICVTEYTIMGLRESLRYLEYCRDTLKVATPMFVATRVGMGGKHQMPQAEFEKGLGQKIAFNIPFVLDAYAAATAGEILVAKTKHAATNKSFHALAAHFVDDAEAKKEPQNKKAKGLLDFLKGGK